MPECSDGLQRPHRHRAGHPGHGVRIRPAGVRLHARAAAVHRDQPGAQAPGLAGVQPHFLAPQREPAGASQIVVDVLCAGAFAEL